MILKTMVHAYNQIGTQLTPQRSIYYLLFMHRKELSRKANALVIRSLTRSVIEAVLIKRISGMRLS